LLAEIENREKDRNENVFRSAGQSRIRMIYFLIVLLAVLVSYRSWRAPIGLHDDISSILRQDTTGYQNWNWIGRGRPLYRLVNQLQKDRWGWQPLSWHLVNTGLHAATGCLLYVVLKNELQLSAARFLALGFVVHPIQTASVNYIAGRSGMLAAFFLIGAAGLYLLPGWWALSSVIPFWLAVQCREDSLVFVLWLPLLMRFR